MHTRKLGRTDIDVSLLSIGGLFTSSLGHGHAETRRILERAVDLGINMVDTAPAYADSEHTLGLALRGIKSPLVISTKLGGRPRPFDAQNVHLLRESVGESLRLLGREVIDVLFLHEPDRPQQYTWWTGYSPLDGPVLQLLEELKQAGTIRFVGLAGTTVTELTALVRTNLFDVVLTAFNFNALFREATRELIPSAAERGMGIVAGSVLGQGFLTRRADSEVRTKPIWLSAARQAQLLDYYQLLDDSGLSPVELCLRFALSEPAISTIPIGCKTVKQLETCVAAIEQGPLPPDVQTRLDSIANMLPTRPFEEPMILPLGGQYVGPGMANLGAAIPIGKV